jgi:peptide/nickel transport system substrate-binding protein
MHHTRKRTTVMMLSIALLLIAGVLWGLTASLADSASPAADSGGKITLKLGITNDPDSLNPFVGYENSAYEVWCLNYDFVIGYGPDGESVPGIAESWDVSDDGKVWTFKIRQGATWQDGEPVTAKDVAFTYNYIVKKKLSAYNSYTTLIEDAVAVDDYTCEVRCSKPKANMEKLYIYCFPEHIWSKIDDPENYKMTYPIIGSGPFQCVEWKKNNYVRLVKNPNYWGGAPTVDEIILQTYQSADSMMQEFNAKLIDGAYDPPAPQYEEAVKQDWVTGYESNLYYFEYLCFNCYAEPTSQGHPILKDVKFRQALNWAIDRDKLVEIGLSGKGRPGTTWMPPDEWPADFDAHYEPTAEEKFGFDIAKANQLLDEAGYTDGDGNGIREYKGKDIELRLWSRTESDPSQKEGKLLAGWFGECGLKIKYEVMDDGALSDKLYAYDPVSCAYSPDFDLYLWDSYGYADPGDTLAYAVTDQIEWWNDACWSNAEYDALVEEQMSEMDREARLQDIYRLQQILYVESPWAVLTYPDSLEVVNSDKWEGWTPFLGGAPFYNAFNVDTYKNLKPKSGEEDDGSSNTTTWIIVAVVAAVVIIVAIVLISRRDKGQAVEE